MSDSVSTPGSTPGKPVGSKSRSDRILQSARHLFTEHGFANTSMDKVAAAAQVSKTTVYQHFADKDALFAAVIALEAQEHTIALTTGADMDFATKLHQVGLEAFDLLLSDTNIAVFRTIAAETVRTPSLGRTFHAKGPAALIGLVAVFLQQAVQSGALRPLDPHLAATHFLGLITSDLQVRALLGDPPALTETLREHYVAQGIKVFLGGYGA